MMKKRVVVALGGNAILDGDASAEAQQANIEKTVAYLLNFIQNGDELVIAHGNGPQVGNLILQQAASDSEENPAMPLDAAVAMTQGSIGYWLQNALDNELAAHHIDREVATVLTQIIVDKQDDAFLNPTKPIGPFLSEAEVKTAAANNKAFRFIEDSGRGFRRVVPSPKPLAIKESKVIANLVSEAVITIACGGGGIPIYQDGDSYQGIEAVIDKDSAAERLAADIDADILIILTGVDNVYVNFNKPNQQKLGHVTSEELRVWAGEGQFPPGSMLPKVEAAIDFVERTGKQAIITSLENLQHPEEGTVISKASHTVS